MSFGLFSFSFLFPRLFFSRSLVSPSLAPFCLPPALRLLPLALSPPDKMRERNGNGKERKKRNHSRCCSAPGPWLVARTAPSTATSAQTSGRRGPWASSSRLARASRAARAGRRRRRGRGPPAWTENGSKCEGTAKEYREGGKRERRGRGREGGFDDERSMVEQNDQKRTRSLLSLSLSLSSIRPSPPLQLPDILHARLVVLHDLREEERERREVELMKFSCGERASVFEPSDINQFSSSFSKPSFLPSVPPLCPWAGACRSG